MLVLRSSAELVRRALEYAAASSAPNTRRAYASDLRQLGKWLKAHGQPIALPLSPAVVALYITDLAARGRRVSTIERALSCVSMTHRNAQLPNPAHAVEVERVLEGIRRTHGIAPKRKAAITPLELAAMLEGLASAAIDVRNRALLLVGFCGALRPGELVALDWPDVEPRGEAGVFLTLRFSKTDPHGEGQTVRLPRGRHPLTCPVRALDDWRTVQGGQGAIFRSVRILNGRVTIGARLWDRDARRIVKRLAGRAGLPSEEFSGHSLRAGLATSAALAGRPAWLIQRKLRHGSLEMLARYIRPAQMAADDAADGLV